VPQLNRRNREVERDKNFTGQARQAGLPGFVGLCSFTVSFSMKLAESNQPLAEEEMNSLIYILLDNVT